MSNCLPCCKTCHCRSSARRCSSSATRKLVIAQCQAGVVGSMPALNARPAEQLEDWLAEITETLAAWDRAHPDQASRAVCHQPDRAQEQRPPGARHGSLCAKYKVPIVITILGAREDVNQAVHGWGGVRDARHHQQQVCAQGDREGRRWPDRRGGGSRVATLASTSPFALVQEIRRVV